MPGGPPGALRGSSRRALAEGCLNEKTYYVIMHVLACTITINKMKKKRRKLVTCLHSPGHSRKIKYRCVITSQLV